MTYVAPNHLPADLDELTEERAAILEHDGGFSRAEAEQIAKGAARNYYAHLMAQDRSRCGCCTNLGALAIRLCSDAERLRDAYHRAVAGTPRAVR